MLRSSAEVEKELEPGFLLFLHDRGWAFAAVHGFKQDSSIPPLYPYDKTARLLLRELDCGRLTGALRDLINNTPSPVVDGCVMIEIRDYRLAFLDFSCLEKNGTIMPSIRRKVLRPTVDTIVTELAEIYIASNPNAAPLTSDTLIALERALLHYLHPPIDLHPSSTVFRKNSKIFYQQHMYNMYGNSRLRFSRKILNAHIIAAHRESSNTPKEPESCSLLASLLKKERPQVGGCIAQRLARVREAQMLRPLNPSDFCLSHSSTMENGKCHEEQLQQLCMNGSVSKSQLHSNMTQFNMTVIPRSHFMNESFTPSPATALMSNSNLTSDDVASPHEQLCNLSSLENRLNSTALQIHARIEKDYPIIHPKSSLPDPPSDSLTSSSLKAPPVPTSGYICNFRQKPPTTGAIEPRHSQYEINETKYKHGSKQPCVAVDRSSSQLSFENDRRSSVSTMKEAERLKPLLVSTSGYSVVEDIQVPLSGRNAPRISSTRTAPERNGSLLGRRPCSPKPTNVSSQKFPPVPDINVTADLSLINKTAKRRGLEMHPSLKSNDTSHSFSVPKRSTRPQYRQSSSTSSIPAQKTFLASQTPVTPSTTATTYSSSYCPQHVSQYHTSESLSPYDTQMLQHTKATYHPNLSMPSQAQLKWKTQEQYQQQKKLPSFDSTLTAGSSTPS
eukprot:gene4031-6468_t